MKLSILSLFLATPIPTLSQSTSPLPIRITTFNIRYAATSLSTGELPWTTSSCASQPLTCRKPHLLAHLTNITTTAPSGAITLFGLQEVLHAQLTDIKSSLGPSWSHLGVARDDGAQKGEYVPILYQNNLLKVLFNETKWLSPTPDKVSYGWNAGSRRIVVLAVFESVTTGKRFIYANTHLDNASAQARTEGIKVVMDRIKRAQEKWGPLGVLLTGDFNSARGEEAHKAVTEGGEMEELFDVAGRGGEVKGENRATFTGFGKGKGSFIDFLWVGKKGEGRWTVQGYEIMGNVEDGVVFSDHRAVVGDVTLMG